jgi:hypothetical protein
MRSLSRNPYIKLTALTVALALIAGLAYTARDDLRPLLKRLTSAEGRWFAEMTLPKRELLQLYDMGVVDANGDGHLDLYTSAHNYRQNLWLADGKGGYRDHLTAWGLDQSHFFPGAEQGETEPKMDKAGLYVYWHGDLLNLVAHKTDGLAPLKGHIQFFNKVEVIANEGFQTSTRVDEDAAIPVTHLDFTTTGGGRLALYVPTRGTPITFVLDAPWARDRVFVGALGVRPSADAFQVPAGGEDTATAAKGPACHWCQRFALALRDRHGMAWSDYNDDGYLDVYITRGALGGTLRKFPDTVRNQVQDEMLVSRALGQFDDRVTELGFRKNDCSGRHVRWVDFDRDGRLDLFINCLDRGNVAGGYPKQLYRQLADGRFVELAAKVGLDIPQHQLIDFAWLDADGDGTPDLLTHEDRGYFLYLQQNGRFQRQFLHRAAFERADVPGLKGNTDDYWQFDGKLSMADFDRDGDLDVFVASKKGNVLLLNDHSRFQSREPASLGLPSTSVAAAWVDFDNDGLTDLHTVPQGLFRQTKPGLFEATGMLTLSDNKYQAAFIHWFDQDNDGRLDVVMALQDNASLWRWWERPFRHTDVKGKDDRFRWRLLAYRNIGPAGRWLQINLRGASGNREAIGTRVSLVSQQGKQTAVIGSSESSYFSQGHYRVYFGIPGDASAATLEIEWPDGLVQKLTDVAPRRILNVSRRTAGSMPPVMQHQDEQ